MKDFKPLPLAGANYHGQMAGEWEARYQSGAFKRRFEFTCHHILNQIDFKGHWLDAGCGSGTFSRFIATQRQIEFTGVDASAAMVEEAAKRAKNSEAAIRMRYNKVETLEKLPFDDNKFDGAICLSVLEYIERPDFALQELARVLKPGAHLIISIPNKASAIRKIQKFTAPVFFKHADKGIAYIRTSKFELVAKNAAAYLQENGFILKQKLFFDPYIPPYMHLFFSPSLIYCICVSSSP